MIRAEQLLGKFYRSFENLYGEGSCGLNVHNAGQHLIYYCYQWGPLWAWSCFGFEDANAMIKQNVHGTGDVTKQVIRFKHAQSVLKKFAYSTGAGSQNLRKLKEACNC